LGVSAADDIRKPSDEEQKMVLSAIDDMRSKPSSGVRAARILGMTSSALNKAIAEGRPSFALREVVVTYLAKKKVIREPTMLGLAEVYGPDARRDWTWSKLRERPGTGEQQAAKSWAFNNGDPKVPLEVAVRVFTRPPWVHDEFASQPVAFWTAQLLWAWRNPPAALTPREKLGELVNEDYKYLKTG
jgi:hypothetical protein